MLGKSLGESAGRTATARTYGVGAFAVHSGILTRMLASDVVRSFTQLTTVLVEETVDEFNKAANQHTATAISRGGALSSGHLLALDGQAATCLASASEKLLQLSLEAHKASPVVDLPARIAQLSTLLVASIDELGAALEAALEARIAKIRERVGGRIQLSQLREAYGRAQLKQSSRLRLLVMLAQNELAAASPPSGASSMVTINGSVGMVQTGAGSFGQVVQNFAAPSMDEVFAALDALEQAIRQSAGAEQQSQGLELVQDLKDQVAREAPNKLKVSSLLGGLTTLVSVMADVQPAWDTVQRWASALKDLVSG